MIIKGNLLGFIHKFRKIQLGSYKKKYRERSISHEKNNRIFEYILNLLYYIVPNVAGMFHREQFDF